MEKKYRVGKALPFCTLTSDIAIVLLTWWKSVLQIRNRIWKDPELLAGSDPEPK